MSLYRNTVEVTIVLHDIEASTAHEAQDKAQELMGDFDFNLIAKLLEGYTGHKITVSNTVIGITPQKIIY